MDRIKLHELRCLDAVLKNGSFQAAATVLNRSHPSVFAAVRRLEERLGIALLDRSGYRVTATDAGAQFQARAAVALHEVDQLQSYAAQLLTGEETLLRVVIGDLMPLRPVLRWLSMFFARHPRTRLHLDYEAVAGPAERLRDGDADLIFHRSVSSDPAIEQRSLGNVVLLPVIAPGFLTFEPHPAITPESMRPFTQCVIRDTARHSATENHFLIEGAHQCSVPDHAMKRELIVHRLAWGHLPAWLIDDDLRQGRLQSIAGANLRCYEERLAVSRLRRDHGPIAEKIWDELAGLRV